MSLPVLPQHANHGRTWHENRFVYPVLSRRSGGLSIGVNLNTDRICNFDCIYCQVDRRSDSETKFVDTDRMLAEMTAVLDLVASGEIWSDDRFVNTPEQLRRLNDIAFSGDGEPTSHKNFPEVVEAVANVKRSFDLDGVKLVLITNASLFHRPNVKRGLELLDANNGEIWAKLDAGTDAYYHLIERTPIPFSRVLENITAAAKIRPLVIQSMFLRLDGSPPSDDEIAAYCDRLNEITAAGGRIKLVQVYTVARVPAESTVTALSNAEVDAIQATVRDRTRLNNEAFYGK
ncbi:MAG: radical SAM protein [Planctomycetaceae bacterium]